eukprot:8272781-Pyramimonas_sp.AAC.1
MLRDFKRTAAKRGLDLRPDPTSTLTNVSRRRTNDKSCHIDGDVVEIFKGGETAEYLGRKLTLDVYHRAELTNVIAISATN